MPRNLEHFKHRQKLMMRECQILEREVDELRRQRLEKEAKLEVEQKTLATQQTLTLKKQQSSGGKYFGNGARLPSDEQLKNPQTLKEILREFGDTTYLDPETGLRNWK